MLGKILVIAGSDCGGGAGLQADIKTINNLNCFATTAITAVTVQNSCEFKDVFPIPSNYIIEQILCILEDFDINAIKIGMMYDLNIMSNIYQTLKSKAANIPVILDPVCNSSLGQELLKTDEESLDFLKTKFIPYSHIITPNIPEAEKICDMDIANLDDMVIAVRKLKDMGANIILLKGGHLNNTEVIHDILFSDKLLKIYESEKINHANTHGSGCSLASAIAANISCGLSIEKSVTKARTYVYDAIKNAIKPAKGNGTLNHFHTVP